jgi:quinoprotein glucose dehydrogenase
MKKYRIGPVYTPPSTGGTLMSPGIIGGANWGGSAFDPETAGCTSRRATSPRSSGSSWDEANGARGESDATLAGRFGGATFTPRRPRLHRHGRMGDCRS